MRLVVCCLLFGLEAIPQTLKQQTSNFISIRVHLRSSAVPLPDKIGNFCSVTVVATTWHAARAGALLRIVAVGPQASHLTRLMRGSGQNLYFHAQFILFFFDFSG